MRKRILMLKVPGLEHPVFKRFGRGKAVAPGAYQRSVIASGPVGDGILDEGGDFLLAENGDYLILE